MDINTIVSAAGVLVVLINSIVSMRNYYNLHKNDDEQKLQWNAINRRALKEDVTQIKEDLEADIKDSESRTQFHIVQINNTIQTAKADIISNIDRLVSALTNK